MKKCPFCAEEIQDEAIKCKHCGSMLQRPADSMSPQVQPPTKHAAVRTTGAGAPLKVVGTLATIGGMLLGIFGTVVTQTAGTIGWIAMLLGIGIFVAGRLRD